jgi:hypothetical protein
LDPGDPNAFRQVRIGDRSYSIDSGVSFVYE